MIVEADKLRSTHKLPPQLQFKFANKRHTSITCVPVQTDHRFIQHNSFTTPETPWIKFSPDKEYSYEAPHDRKAYVIITMLVTLQSKIDGYDREYLRYDVGFNNIPIMREQPTEVAIVKTARLSMMRSSKTLRSTRRGGSSSCRRLTCGGDDSRTLTSSATWTRSGNSSSYDRCVVCGCACDESLPPGDMKGQRTTVSSK